MVSSLGVNITHQEVRDGLFLTIGVVAPFILRSIGDLTIGFILDRCCKLNKKELAAHLVGTGDSRVTIWRIWKYQYSWSSARDELGLNTCGAILISTIRLLFWHWLQPMLYGLVLFAYWNLLVEAQQTLGLIVGIREALYWLMTIMALCRNPSYLLVDLKATWNGISRTFPNSTIFGPCFQVALYVLAPEKYVAIALVKRNRCEELAGGILIGAFLPLLDLAGMIGFCWAFAVHNVFIPMIIGYSVTMIAALFLLGWGICGHFCGNPSRRAKVRFTSTQDRNAKDSQTKSCGSVGLFGADPTTEPTNEPSVNPTQSPLNTAEDPQSVASVHRLRAPNGSQSNDTEEVYNSEEPQSVSSVNLDSNAVV